MVLSFLVEYPEIDAHAVDAAADPANMQKPNGAALRRVELELEGRLKLIAAALLL